MGWLQRFRKGKPPDDEPIVLVLPKDAVDAGDTTAVVQFLTVLVRSDVLAPQALGKLRVVFSGFEADGRELWEVPELRKFIADVDAALPFWFYLADLATPTLQVIALSLCRTTSVKPGVTAIDNAGFVRFMQRQFEGMNELFARCGLSDEENVRRTDELMRYFGQNRLL